ncbi:hypothetical protein ACFX5D_04615 [Flavobacterium sp. LB3P45]|uniref:Uncharacterized protein n=1 Tax=Flavobacterium fructosi TaxID=3230416 RepID=A0ABW6HJP2_9FLAO
MELKKVKKKSGGFSYNFDDIFTVIINERIGGIDFVLNLLYFIEYQMIDIPNAWSFIDFYIRKANSFRAMGRSGMTNNQYLNDLFQKYRAIKRCRIINEIIN